MVLRRVLLDTGAEGWYTSLKLIDTLKERPMEIKTKRIHMYMANVHALDVLIATYSHRTWCQQVVSDKNKNRANSGITRTTPREHREHPVKVNNYITWSRKRLLLLSRSSKYDYILSAL